ncbi:hypothetical protein BKA70DRAFT_1220442 [Coprinopsis sp. MPI-PUGE-AT-0042]|nr:hypothetical protein BKA70DRAFT_1220442 [Coprinopsis sp. MPI-PUGE-AT-0042]
MCMQLGAHLGTDWRAKYIIEDAMVAGIDLLSRVSVVMRTFLESYNPSLSNAPTFSPNGRVLTELFGVPRYDVAVLAQPPLYLPGVCCEFTTWYTHRRSTFHLRAGLCNENMIQTQRVKQSHVTGFAYKYHLCSAIQKLWTMRGSRWGINIVIIVVFTGHPEADRKFFDTSWICIGQTGKALIMSFGDTRSLRKYYTDIGTSLTLSFANHLVNLYLRLEVDLNIGLNRTVSLYIGVIVVLAVYHPRTEISNSFAMNRPSDVKFRVLEFQLSRAMMVVREAALQDHHLTQAALYEQVVQHVLRHTRFEHGKHATDADATAVRFFNTIAWNRYQRGAQG